MMQFVTKHCSCNIIRSVEILQIHGSDQTSIFGLLLLNYQ